MKSARVLVLAAIVSTFGASQAFADLTGFIGANTTPKNRHTQGFAVGGGLLLVGFEFEYASTPDEPNAMAPALTTGSGNFLLQAPFAIFGFQPYATTGGGLYRETLGTHQQTGFALNSGGGVKISLAGPLRLRLDYRVLKLGEKALQSPVHRVYVGLNLKF
jgi:opacity protein-like surface antigen